MRLGIVIIMAVLMVSCASTTVRTSPDPLMATYVALSVADIGTTLAGLDSGNVEANPVAALYVDSMPAIMAVTFLRVAIMRELSGILGEHSRAWKTSVTLALIALEVAVVVNNMCVIRRRQ